MSWDWEKLQEKRQRQPRNKPGDGRDPFEKVDFNKLKSFFGKGRSLAPLVIVALLLWFASGIFIVTTGEVGVVTRFGKFNRTVADGPHYRLPYPFESSTIVNVRLLRTVVLGQSSDSVQFASQAKAEESSMFTRDENIVHMQFNVQYNLGEDGEVHENARKYLFNVKAPDAMVAIAAEAAMREVVGANDIDNILTASRAAIQIRALDVLQVILDTYDCGIHVQAVQLLDVQPPAEVAEAFKDVASAREDRVRIINQAEAYQNEIVPVANGTAKSMVNAAEGYARQVTLGAEGQANRFLAMVGEYNKAKDITEKRMRLEAMQDIFSSPGIEKIILNNGATKGGYLPFLNLDRTNPTLPAITGTSIGGGAR